MARIIQLFPNSTKERLLNFMNKHSTQFSPYERRERRYPFLVAIDLMLHFALSIAAIILTTIALMMTFEALWATVVWRLVHRG